MTRIRSATTAADTSAAVALLARAFAEHPVYRYVLPDDDVRRRRLPGLMRTMVVTMYGAAGPLEVARDPGGAIVGAAAWHCPDAPAPSTARMVRAVPAMAWATRSRLADWTALGSAMDPLRPAEPHWYLFHVGADPRGTGVGSTLVRHGLERAAGFPVHLECAPDLAGYYARFGFVEGEPVPVEGLDLVTMTRPAIPARGEPADV